MSNSEELSESITARLERLEQSVNKREPKDLWDKLSAVSALLSGIVIASLGYFATTVYNERQLDATSAQKDRELAALELQTVEAFFEYLSSDDTGLQRSSLQMIASLRDAEFAMKLAADLDSIAGEEFLRELTLSSVDSISAEAEKTLAGLEQARITRLDSELSYRLRFLRDLIHDGEINGKIMSEVQNVLEQSPPSEQNYIIGGSNYRFEEYADRNLVSVFNILNDVAPENRSATIGEAIQAVDRFQTMILLAPTREVLLAEHIVDSVPDFSDAQILEVQDLIKKLDFWIELGNG